MNATIEQLETIHTPLATITPTIWRDGDMCGLASLRELGIEVVDD